MKFLYRLGQQNLDIISALISFHDPINCQNLPVAFEISEKKVGNKNEITLNIIEQNASLPCRKHVSPDLHSLL